MSTQCVDQYVPCGAGVCTAGGDGILIGSGATGKRSDFVAHEAVSSESVSKAPTVASTFFLSFTFCPFLGFLHRSRDGGVACIGLEKIGRSLRLHLLDDQVRALPVSSLAALVRPEHRSGEGRSQDDCPDCGQLASEEVGDHGFLPHSSALATAGRFTLAAGAGAGATHVTFTGTGADAAGGTTTGGAM